MTKSAIQFRTTLWYTAILIGMTALTVILFRTVSASVLQKTLRGYLVSAVESNVDKIRVLPPEEAGLQMIREVSEEENDIFLAWNGQILSIDANFLDIINDVSSALYDESGTMLYGENPLALEMEGEAFSVSRFYNIKHDGTSYIVYDRKLTEEGLSGLWIRGMVPLTQSLQQLSDITRVLYFVLPVLVALAVLGGYLFTGRMLKTVHEMEEYNRLEAQYAAEQRFTSDASHELRTPMSVILAQTELTLEEEHTPGEYKDALHVIERQGKRMSDLINDMLDYTRLEQRKSQYPMSAIDFSALTESISTDLALIKEKDIALTQEIAPDCHISGNATLLARLLQNLISNAYRYGKEGGHIHVSLQRTSAGSISLAVTDDGQGIAESDLPHLFERFYRADASRSSKGNGLGLSMVKKIAEMHGAKVDVASKVGEGSIFTVTFPAV